MAKIDVVDIAGKKVGSFELADEVFGVINEDLLWEAVTHYRAAQRSGTHATKNKTRAMRKALDVLGADKPSLLVAHLNPENRQHSRNLWLGSRNLEGVELVSGHEVHPYHLLRYERAIFSRPAIERLQDSLKKTVSKRQKAEVA